MQRLDHAQVKQAQRGTAAEHQRRTAKALRGALEKAQFGRRGKLRIFAIAQLIQRSRNLLEILAQQQLGAKAALRIKGRVGHVAQITV